MSRRVGSVHSETLAVLGGKPSVLPVGSDELFVWPVVGNADREAVAHVLGLPNFEGSGNVAAFEEEFARFCGVRHAVGQVNGTNAVLAAMWACGVGPGDEVVVPTTTYWATAMPAASLGATPVFADVDPFTMNVDVNSIKRAVTKDTRAIVVVHMLGYPVDMDPILEFASNRNIRVIEDASHAHGSRYKNRVVGSLGDIAAFSMSGKPLATGGGGIVVTDSTELHERVLAWGQNFRFHQNYIGDRDLLRYAGLPLGHVTSRLHPLSAALAREQLRCLPERMSEIDRAMNLFWDHLEGLPGVRPHRPPKDSDTSMGAWYQPHGIYVPSELDDLSVSRFIEAVRAEGFPSWSRNIIREPLHRHAAFRQPDLGSGRYLLNGQVLTAVRTQQLPVSESLKAFSVPPLKHFDEQAIEAFAALFKKVLANYKDLLAGDRGESFTVDERGNG